MSRIVVDGQDRERVAVPAGESLTVHIDGRQVVIRAQGHGDAAGADEEGTSPGGLPTSGGQRPEATQTPDEHIARPSRRKPARARPTVVVPDVIPTALQVRGLSASYSARQPPQIADITFSARPGSLVGIVGPSGSGKTTLLRALVGQLSFGGSIWYAGEMLDDDSRSSIRNRLSIVTQSDLAESSLPLVRSLQHVADLRMPTASAAQRRQAVEDVVRELRLVERAGTPVNKLSGGQRKRAAVGAALLARSPVIFLDEPTTGLDPESERSLLQRLRELAESGGRTIVMITHSPEALYRCHEVLVLCPRPNHPAGVAYVGPPHAMPRHFRAQDVAGMYRVLYDTSQDWVSTWRHEVSSFDDPQPEAALVDALRLHRSWVGPARQAVVKAGELLQQVLWDSRAFLSLVSQIAVLMALLTVVMGFDNLTGSGEARTFLGFTAVAATFPSLLNSTQLVVQEVDLLRRDMTVGMSSIAYLASKFLFMAVVCLAQSLMLAATFGGQGGGRTGALLPTRSADIVVVLFTTSLATAALGLMVSALASDVKQLLLYLPAMIVAQIIFSGAFMDLSSPMSSLATAVPSHWAFQGLASANDLTALDPLCRRAFESGAEDCSAAWSRDAGVVLKALLANLVLVATYLAAAFRCLIWRHRDRF